MNQRELIFFGDRDPHGRSEPTDEEKRARVDSGNPLSPFSKFIGNERAVKKLQTAAFSALGQENHVQRDLSFAIFGPSSAGKTTIARIYAQAVELPFVEISPKAVRTLNDVKKLAEQVLDQYELPLVDEGKKRYTLPPSVIFIDEVHAVCDAVIQGLLKATEFSDGIMVTECGEQIDTTLVTWMIATTDEGRLFDAFRTRFSPVVLQYLPKRDISKIVKLNNPSLPPEVCDLVSHYNSRVPRKALEFARYMKMRRDMDGGSWENVARLVAADEGIDEYGMHEVHLRVLRALNCGPVSQGRMPAVVERKLEEVERNIMPWLLSETEDSSALVQVTPRGYAITDAGVAELKKRVVPS